MVDKLDIAKFLMQIGLDSQESSVYISLLKLSEQTPLSLARSTNINRTTLYRILESLERKGLVRRALQAKSTKFAPSNPKILKNLITKKEEDIKKIKEDLDLAVTALSQIKTENPNPTKVKYYQGQTGLRQLLWNLLNARTDVVGFGYGDWNLGIGKKYAEILREEFVSHEIHSRELLNLNQVDHTFSFTDNQEYRNKFYKHRGISPKIITINHDTYIYNDVFAFYHIYKGEYFGVEIENTEIAKTQRQIFEYFWKLSKNKT